MRERLIAAFVVLTVALLIGAGAVRSFALRDQVREQVADRLHEEAGLVAAVLTEKRADGDPVDPRALAALVGPEVRLVYAPAGQPEVVVDGADYRDGDGPDSVTATARVGTDAQVTLSASPSVVNELAKRDLGAVAALFAIIAVLAATAGLVVATLLAAPFRKLAVAAGALGRGRFDLDLPRTRVPEARAIATALSASARSLEARVQRERAFAEHASHVLRTPLTGVRLELEELALREDLPADARATAAQCVARVDEVSAVAAELVEIARRDSLVAGAEVSLSELSTQLVQRWTDRLAADGRPVSGAVEGDLTLTYTPGPVEQATDLLLADVVRRGRGAARLVLCGEPGGHLRIRVSSAQAGPTGEGDAETGDPLRQARMVVDALGGRVNGAHPADGLELLLPRR